MSMIHESNFNKRNSNRYNPTEDIFIEYAKYYNINYRRYGFDETQDDSTGSDKYPNVHPFIRCTPDFISPDVITELYEVKGGKEYMVLKEKQIEWYGYWNKIHKLNFFLVHYDSWEYKILSFNDYKYCAETFGRLDILDKGTPSEQKAYFLNWDMLDGYKSGKVYGFTGVDRINEIIEKMKRD